MECLSENFVVGDLLKDSYELIFKVMRFSQVLANVLMEEKDFRRSVWDTFAKNGNVYGFSKLLNMLQGLTVNF